MTPTYKILKEEGPDHEKIFTVGVFVSQKKLGTGTGHSKQEAEATAAAEAIKTYKNSR